MNLPQYFTRKRTAQGYTLIELLVVLMIIGVLASIALASYTSIIRKVSCIARQGDLPGLCWPEPKKSGWCWVASKDCFFPRPGRRPDNVYSQPNGYKGVKGFYINLTNADSSATVRYKAYLCSKKGISIEGSQPLEGSITESDYLDARNNYIEFSQRVCGFEFFLIQKSRSNGNRIDFDMNFAVD